MIGKLTLGAPLVAGVVASAKLPQGPDIVAAGQVMSTLNDWRAIMVSQFVVIAFLAVLIIWLMLLLRAQAKSDERMVGEIARLARAVFAFRIALAYREKGTVDIAAIEQELDG